MIENYSPHWMNEELEALRDMARRFVAEQITPNQENWYEAGATDRDTWLKAGELGLLCPDISGTYGGTGGSFAHVAVMAHELCLAGDASWRPGQQIHLIAAHYIERYGSEAQKQKYLPGLCSGELIAGMGMTEPNGGTDLQNMRTRAVRNGDNYIIDGAKTFITNGSICDILILAAKTNPAEKAKGVSLFIVETKKGETKTPGFLVSKRLKKIGLHGSDTCELFFDGCEVAAANLLGEVEGQGFYQMMRDLTYERALTGVNCAAVIQHAFEVTRDYAKERQMFGSTLNALQNTRFELAEVKTIATIARVFADFTVERMLDGTMDTSLASMSKWWISEQQCDTVSRCLQLFGGHGYMLENPIARMFVDSRIEPIYAGSNEILKDLIGRSLFEVQVMMATIKNPHPRLVIYGVGQFGLHVIRMAASKNWPIVAAFNRAGSKVGRDIGRLAGLDRDLGVVVQDCDTADFNLVKADIGVVAMTDRLALNMPAYKRLMNAGMNVVCHGSEAYYPTGIDKDLAAEIDALARRNNVSFTGTGIWDYSRIWAGIVVAGPCTDITRVFHRSITNAQGYGERLMLLTGVGMTPEEYDEKVGKVQGMLGGFYKTIPHQVMEALGYHAISVTETREPVLFDKPIHCSLLGKDIAPGLAAGTRIVIRVETEEGIPAEAHIELRLFWPEESEHMMWHIEGKPSSKITVERDDSGYATAACLFNRIPDVIAAEPGLRVLSQLGPMKHTALLP